MTRSRLNEPNLLGGEMRPPRDRPAGECWEWDRVSDRTGYAYFFPTRTKAALAHRWSYEYFRAEIPPGLEIDHLCRNRACPNGHPYSSQNTEAHSRGHRQCLTCRKERERRFMVRRESHNLEGATP